MRLRTDVARALERLRGGELSARRLGWSVALGLFVGCSPFFGLHAALAGAIAFFLRLDVLVAFLASNVSLPPLIPLVLFVELQVGTLLIEGRFLPFELQQFTAERALSLGAGVLVGWFAVGAAVALFGGAIAFGVGHAIEVRRGAADTLGE